MKKLKVIDLFAGVGGLSYGFSHDNAFKIIAANELLPNMAKAYELNHPSVKMYCKDICSFGIKDLQKDLGVKKGDIDIIIGGPPCQAYSTIGKRKSNDPRGSLYNEYFRVLQEIQPKLFVFENVKGLISMENGKLLPKIIELFESLDYKIVYKMLNAADYGTPQIRERVFVVGTKLNKNFKFPSPTHYNPELNNDLLFNDLKPYITIEEAIGDLPSMPSGKEITKYTKPPKNDYQKKMRENSKDKLNDHDTANNNPNLVKIMEMLPDGGTPEDIPKKYRPKSGYINTYCRLWWKKPSTTITRNLGTPSSSRCIHPKDPRSLSTREGARLQGFPDDYIFYGSRMDKNLQIGNAVPVFLSISIKDAIKEHFNLINLVP